MFVLFAICRKGAAAVEAALVFPVLIFLTLAAIEFSFVLFTNSAMQSAAREVSRQLAVNYISISQVPSKIGDRLPKWVSDNDTQVSVSQSNPADPTNNLITVSVSLPARKASPLHFLINTLGDLTLGSSVTMKQEQPLNPEEES